MLLASLALTTGLAALEAGYRCADASDAVGISRVGARWSERHDVRNDAGIRDDVDYGASPPPPGVRRLTFLGDSVTAGQGIADVRDRFANRVRRALAPSWEVHVFAENGADTGAELARVRDLAQHGYRTDFLVLVYFPNDISDLLTEYQASIARLLEQRRREPALVRASFAFDTWYWRLRIRLDPVLGHYHDLVREAYTGDSWNRQAERLHELQAASAVIGARLVVVTFPFLDRLEPGDPFLAVDAQLARFWADAGVAHLDLSRRFAASDASSLVVSRLDAHPNERAHAIAGDAIVAFLRTEVEGER